MGVIANMCSLCSGLFRMHYIMSTKTGVFQVFYQVAPISIYSKKKIHSVNFTFMFVSQILNFTFKSKYGNEPVEDFYLFFLFGQKLERAAHFPSFLFFLKGTQWRRPPR